MVPIWRRHRSCMPSCAAGEARQSPEEPPASFAMPPDPGQTMSPKIEWQRDDYSRVPYVFYHDAGIFDEERHKIFAGKTWSYLALDADLPEPGDFKTTYMGDIPIL